MAAPRTAGPRRPRVGVGVLMAYDLRALAEAEGRNPGGQGQARGRDGGQQSDPLGRMPGLGATAGTQDNLLQGEDVYRRARDLLDEIRRRSGEGERPELERNYLKRLLDRF